MRRAGLSPSGGYSVLAKVLKVMSKTSADMAAMTATMATHSKQCCQPIVPSKAPTTYPPAAQNMAAGIVGWQSCKSMDFRTAHAETAMISTYRDTGHNQHPETAQAETHADQNHECWSSIGASMVH